MLKFKIAALFYLKHCLQNSNLHTVSVLSKYVLLYFPYKAKITVDQIQIKTTYHLFYIYTCYCIMKVKKYLFLFIDK